MFIYRSASKARLTLLLAIVGGLTMPFVGASAGGDGIEAHDYGKAFVPKPVSPVQYDMADEGRIDDPTDSDSVPARDGTELFVEWWLPTQLPAGPPVPSKLPTVVNFDPYGGIYREYLGMLMRSLIPRGYAFALAQVRGSGQSGGCLEWHGPQERDDSAHVINWIAHQPWSDGNVGLYGVSYDGGAAVAAATWEPRGPDPDLIAPVKAVVAISPLVSVYDFAHQDGVKYLAYQELIGVGPGSNMCKPGELIGSSDPTGNVTHFYKDRDDRARLQNLRAATLVSHGMFDPMVRPGIMAGFFDRIPATTPRAGVFAGGGHAWPDDREDTLFDPMLARADWLDMQIAWFDRYLKGLDSGVESWPVAQVQGNDERWRAEPDWPKPSGRLAQLALGPSAGAAIGGLTSSTALVARGSLGNESPSGSTSYVEGGPETPYMAPGTYAVFDSAPLSDRLEITGEPVLDLWVTLDRPDAHVAVRLETYGPNWERLGVRGRDAFRNTYDSGVTYGFRSAQHLDPLTEHRFWQSQAKLAPTSAPGNDVAVNIKVRLQPTDLVIPKGGHVRIIVAGSLRAREGLESQFDGAVDAGSPEYEQTTDTPWLIEDPSTVSGSATQVTILHDCKHPSALRFLVPPARPKFLDVREPTETYAELGNHPLPSQSSDGGGDAIAPVCGRAPMWPGL